MCPSPPLSSLPAKLHATPERSLLSSSSELLDEELFYDATTWCASPAETPSPEEDPFAGLWDGDGELAASPSTSPPPLGKRTRAHSSSSDSSAVNVRSRCNLHHSAVAVLKAWMMSPEHFDHPYPDEKDKAELTARAGITVKQLTVWFTNARKRLWVPLRKRQVCASGCVSAGLVVCLRVSA